jgi:dTMP kinase
MKGIFISFEGGEGSGKTSQSKLLANWLMGQWHGRVTQTREPGGTCGGEQIRELLVKGDSERWDSVTEALLMTAARRDNLMRVIKPALERGEAVITDRFFDSMSVYQGLVGGASADFIHALNSLALDGIKPDVTILLDIDPKLGLARSNRAENDETRFEDKGAEFHQQVRKNYLTIAKAEASRFLVIDAARDEKTIHDDITAQLAPWLENQASEK